MFPSFEQENSISNNFLVRSDATFGLFFETCKREYSPVYSRKWLNDPQSPLDIHCNISVTCSLCGVVDQNGSESRQIALRQQSKTFKSNRSTIQSQRLSINKNWKKYLTRMCILSGNIVTDLVFIGNTKINCTPSGIWILERCRTLINCNEN